MASGLRVTFMSTSVRGPRDLGSPGGTQATTLKWAMSPDMGTLTVAVRPAIHYQ